MCYFLFQYDSTYGRNRNDTSISRCNGTERPTTVTAKYINTTPTYKSSSIPIRRDKSNSREQTESPITAIANKYANYKLNKDEKPVSKYTDKKESYNKLAVPPLTNKSRDVSPVSTSSKYSLSRSSRHLSPDRRIATSITKGRSRDPSPAERDKNIPNKTDKSSSYNTLSSYKLYPRSSSSYSRPVSRSDIKPEITINRYSIANRLTNTYLRSPSAEKTIRASVSPIKHNEIPKIETDRVSKSKTDNDIDNRSLEQHDNITQRNDNEFDKEINSNNTTLANGYQDTGTDEQVTVVTRHTSPTPPGSSAYVRTRRADMAKVLEKTITRLKIKPQMVDKEVQADRLDDTSRCNRFTSTGRGTISNWSMYTPNITSYTGYAGRYSTQYLSSRESPVNNSCNDKTTNQLRLTENNTEQSNNNKYAEHSDSEQIKSTVVTSNNEYISGDDPEISTTVEQNKDDDTSEIIINVNLKLKKAKNPMAAELVSPEITITNSQLPPQAPKSDITTKPKKIKVRKSSTDSSSDSSSKKKVVKKRSKSVSSTDSEAIDGNTSIKLESHSSSPSKVISRNSSGSNIKSIKKKTLSRESNSPESCSTLSTQSSISEDETNSKSKTIDISRTSADEPSFSLDRSHKQSSPPLSQRNEGADDAKSFLIRALAPVTNLFKIKHSDSSENTNKLESSTSESTSKDISNLITESDISNKSKSNAGNIIASNNDNLVKLKSIKRIDSGDKLWRMDTDKNSGSFNKQKSSSEKNIQVKIKHVESGERAWWLESNSDSKNEHNYVLDKSETSKNSTSNKLGNYDSEEKPWWLDSSANIPDGVQRLTPPKKVNHDSDKSDKYDFYKVRHVESGEKDWWLTSNENSSSNKDTQSCDLSNSTSDHRSFPLRRIRHIESGERPWWLSSTKNIPEGVEKLPTPPPQCGSDSSDSEEIEAYPPTKPHIPPFPLSLPDDEPLGDRRSPEGLETPQDIETREGRNSPYENARYKNMYHKENFITRYTDIDDILGTSGQMYSPFMDLILARRTGQAFEQDMSECKEIDPTQVRIHDSTPQRPVIKKIRSR